MAGSGFFVANAGGDRAPNARCCSDPRVLCPACAGAVLGDAAGGLTVNGRRPTRSDNPFAPDFASDPGDGLVTNVPGPDDEDGLDLPDATELNGVLVFNAANGKAPGKKCRRPTANAGGWEDDGGLDLTDPRDLDGVAAFNADPPAGLTGNRATDWDDTGLSLPDPADLNGVAAFRPRR